ncbi:MAG: hypothetical protein WKG06_15930 [Segetibacter sp.]
MRNLLKAYAFSNSLEPLSNDLLALYSSSQISIIKILLDAYFEVSFSNGLLVANAGSFTYKDITLSQKALVDQEVQSFPGVVESLLSTSFSTNGDFIFGTAVSVEEKIAAASEYLEDLASQLIRLYNGLNALSEKYLNLTITQHNEHQPHVALFYAFLKLVEEHKSAINDLLLKHLDFYYRQVLCIKEKNWQPDQAFVTFELTKNVNEHFIAKGSLLSAGKDPDKKDILYKTLQDILVNKAELAEIRSFTFISGGRSNIRNATPGIFGATVANSLDGKGKPLLPGQSWEAFRSSVPPEDLNQQIGLSFYSALLQEVQEETDFELELNFKQELLKNENIINPKIITRNEDIKGFFIKFGKIRILTEEDPFFIDINITSASISGTGIKIPFTIGGKTKLSKASPNASIIFGHKSESVGASEMDVIKMFQTARLSDLHVGISNHEVEVKHVETVAGKTDLSSAFTAFGGIPKVGNSLYVIEPLLLNRTVSGLTMSVEWEGETEKTYKVNVIFPSKTGGSSQETIAEKSLNTNFILKDTPVLFTGDQIKVTLLESLGHATYANEITTAIIALQNKTNLDPDTGGQFEIFISKELRAKKEAMSKEFAAQNTEREYPVQSNSSIDLPPPPYTPMIKSIKLTVNLKEEILSESTLDLVFQQHPYGYRKFKSIDPVTLIPLFQAEGELYFGFNNILRSQSLNILIAVEEGSADPELQNPEVSWTYLQDNEWKLFAESQFHDGTNGLIQSGIVSFVLPDEDTTKNTLLPGGYFWLKAAVPFNQSNAVSRIISVNTQAVLVQFDNHDNDPSYPGTNVPANTITNLFPKRAAIKSVNQQFLSFNGRKTEDSSHIYIRSSERLRHKGRGVSAWDYENVILQQFPEIYKVKVLPHACPYKGNNNKTAKIISKAGSVLVLTVAKTYAKNSVYKPLVSKSKLTEIYNFIRPQISPFAQLSVINPLFEEIQLNVEVEFLLFVKDRLFYEAQLQEDIKRFLLPWAYNDGREPEFGGVIYKSAVLDYIEELPYIDFVKKLEIVHAGSSSRDMAKAASPASILISALQHEVKGQLKSQSVDHLNLETIAFC